MSNNAQQFIENVKASLERIKPTDPDLLSDYIAVKEFLDMVIGVDSHPHKE